MHLQQQEVALAEDPFLGYSCGHLMILHNLTTERPNFFTNHSEIKQYVHTQTAFFKWYTLCGNFIKTPADFLSSNQNGFSVRKWQCESELLNLCLHT